jgi:hypothetical protein
VRAVITPTLYGLVYFLESTVRFNSFDITCVWLLEWHDLHTSAHGEDKQARSICCKLLCMYPSGSHESFYLPLYLSKFHLQLLHLL